MICRARVRPALLAAVLALVTPQGARALSRHPQAAPGPLPIPEPPFPFGADWTLVDIDGKPVSGDRPSFRLDDKDRATGFAGCNTYSMTLYPVRNQRLLAGAIAMTHKSCDRPAMVTERLLLVGLHSAPTWRLENGELLIRTSATSMRFRRGI